MKITILIISWLPFLFSSCLGFTKISTNDCYQGTVLPLTFKITRVEGDLIYFKTGDLPIESAISMDSFEEDLKNKKVIKISCDK